MKLFKACDPAGYTYRFLVYAGKSESTVNTASDVVLRLAEPYLNSGRTICTDNFYTSIPLAVSLLEHETHLVGTVRKNRKGLPGSVINAKLNRGETTAQENSMGIVVAKWHDTRDVLMRSTRHSGAMVTVQGRRKEKIKPDIIAYYNRCKQGIDVSDQLSSYQSALRKSVRWYHKVAIELILGTAIVNALLLYNERCVEAGRQTMQVAVFKKKLVQKLLKLDDNQDIVIHKHYLRETLEREQGKRSDRRRRRVCTGCYSDLKKTDG